MVGVSEKEFYCTMLEYRKEYILDQALEIQNSYVKKAQEWDEIEL